MEFRHVLFRSGVLVDVLHEHGEEQRMVGRALAVQELPHHDEREDQHDPDEERLMSLAHWKSFRCGERSWSPTQSLFSTRERDRLSARHTQPKYCPQRQERQTLVSGSPRSESVRAGAGKTLSQRRVDGRGRATSAGRRPGTNRISPSAVASTGKRARNPRAIFASI